MKQEITLKVSKTSGLVATPSARGWLHTLRCRPLFLKHLRVLIEDGVYTNVKTVQSRSPPMDQKELFKLRLMSIFFKRAVPKGLDHTSVITVSLYVCALR